MKKMIGLLLIGICLSIVFLGCSSTVENMSIASASAEKSAEIITPEVTQDLVIDEETKKKIEQTEVKDASVYFNWTLTDWENAEETEQETCVLTYIAMKNENAKSEDLRMQNVSDVTKELETLLKENPDKTIKELVVSA